MQAATTLQSCGALHKRLPHTKQQGEAPQTMNQHAGSFDNVEQQLHPVMEGVTPSMLLCGGQVEAPPAYGLLDHASQPRSVHSPDAAQKVDENSHQVEQLQAIVAPGGNMEGDEGQLQTRAVQGHHEHLAQQADQADHPADTEGSDVSRTWLGQQAQGSSVLHACQL